jgi:hypothetical protein
MAILNRTTKIVDYIEDIPVIECQMHKTDQVKFYCSHCNKAHYHSYAPEPDLPTDVGHRVAHCHSDNSPFSDTKYCLRLATN